MTVLNLVDYKLNLAEKICVEKFQNDTMLVICNFHKKSQNKIIDLIKYDIKKFQLDGIVLDYKLIQVLCTMYLGLAWSMYRKGKSIQKNSNFLDYILTKESKDVNINEIVDYIDTNNLYSNMFEYIAERYFTLYFRKYVKDVLARMDITCQTIKRDENALGEMIKEHMERFGIKVLALGVYDEYNK
ncbi:hypothetical protein [Thermohalobacter berrensis]|uniref:Uncharacterized protein n=1 Tax=Thermohalobacter berrensis TaxID=99594 RepID=A0A419T5F8_9FIRM|nr:hypothetical protein [Thermohalobacter berrensis]RKD32711.1 hypothetical protein BET03_10265 [Thermohalobacter berrensis]